MLYDTNKNDMDAAAKLGVKNDRKLDCNWTVPGGVVKLFVGPVPRPVYFNLSRSCGGK